MNSCAFALLVTVSRLVCSLFSKAALIALGYEEVALDDFWSTFLQELDALPSMEMGQLEVGVCRSAAAAVGRSASPSAVHLVSVLFRCCVGVV